MSANPKILLVLTSHGELGDTGRSTGFYLPEAAHPWRVFSDAGFQVELVSPQGGRPPMDGADLSDPAQQAFLDEMAGKLDATHKPGQIDQADFDAILYVGGHGAMWDFPGNADLAEIARAIYETGGVVAAVCHGPAGLLDITLSDGRHLVDGQPVAAFTNSEEALAELTGVVPFLLQTALEERGAKHSAAPDFAPHTVTGERLVTGQNPASATGVGEAVVKILAG